MRPDVGGFLPVFVIDEYDGYEVKRVQDSTRAELDAWVDANATPCASTFPRTSSSSTTSSWAAQWARRWAALRRQGARLRARVLDARECRALRVGGGGARRCAVATIVGSEHIREVVADVCGQTEHVHEVPPGVDVELWRPARGTKR